MKNLVTCFKAFVKGEKKKKVLNSDALTSKVKSLVP